MPARSIAPTQNVSVPFTEHTVDYRRFFESLPFGFIAVAPNDPEFTIVAENQAHADAALVTLGDALGKPLFEVFPDISDKYKNTGINDVAESIRRVIKSGKSDAMDIIRYDLYDATERLTIKYWQLTHYPLFDAANELILIYQSTEDVTQATATGSNYKRIQQQLDEALSAGMVGTWLWDVNADLITGDKNMAAMFDVLPAEAALGLPLNTFTASIHPHDRTRVKQEISAVIKSGGKFYSEYRTQSRSGQVRWLIAQGRLVYDGNGKLTSFPGVLLDITDRKLVENNLSYLSRASEILSSSLDFKETLKNTASLMVLDIADWCTVEILDEAGLLRQVAVSHKDADKVAWAQELYDKRGPQNLDDQIGVAQVLRTGKPEFYPVVTDDMLVMSAKSPEELSMLRQLGLTSAIIAPLKIQNRTVGAITLILSEQKRHYNSGDLDMAIELANRASLAMTNANLYDEAQKELHERTRLERALLAANDELEDRVEARTNELEDSNLNLQRSNQELQDFAYVASHDLQEPLRKIQAFGNLLESEYGTALGEGKDYLARMRNAAARMSALIEDILSFSRVTSKGREFISVDLEKIAEEVVEDLEVRIAETGAVVTIDKLPTIQADAMQMRQLLQNLIANAIKFHRKDVNPIIDVSGTVERLQLEGTSSRLKRKYCRLEIHDNGLGFDEKYLDRIFAVFQRLHNRDTYAGTGIGLAVCRKIVERHGGTITATSTEGVGSIFIIMLPMQHNKGEALL